MRHSRISAVGMTLAVALVITASLVAVSPTTASAAPSQPLSPRVGASGVITRSGVISRAQQWVAAHVPYNMYGYYDGWREDCSGFVSMAWGLDDTKSGNGGLNTVGLYNLRLNGIARVISKDELQPGDILVNPYGGGDFNDEHTLIFAGWATSTHSSYYAYEESWYYGGAVYQARIHNGHQDGSAIPWPYYPGYHSDLYVPMRLNALDSAPSGPAIDNASFVNQSPPVTVSAGSPFQIYFSVENVGSTSWSDSYGYSLQCIHTCMGPNSVGEGNNVSVPPLATHQYVLNLTAPPTQGSYTTYWRLAHSGTQFGPGMWISINVGSQSSNNGSSTSSTCSLTPPTPVGPSNRATVQSGTDVVLSWQNACPLSYVELSGSNYGTLNFGGWNTWTSADIGALWPGTYTWHVKAGDGQGNSSNWSAQWTLVVNAPSTPTPTSTPQTTGLNCSTPSLSSPGNGASYSQTQSITLSWSTNCTQSYAELSGGPYGTLNFGGWMNSSSAYVGQMWPGTYTWHIMGKDSNGNQTGWSASWSFTITSNPTPVPNTPPSPTPTNPPSLSCSTPSLSSPGNGASYSQSTSITISWNTNCAQSYAELSGGPYGTLNFGGWKSTNSIVIGQMWPGTYTWHVMGMDSNGNQTGWSSSWTFTVNSNPTPTPTPSNPCNITPLSPPNGASYPQSQSITLQWSTSCSQSYVELSGGPYGTLNFGGWKTTNYIVIGQMWPGTYTWHVMGIDSSGNQTAWSQSFTFTIQ